MKYILLLLSLFYIQCNDRDWVMQDLFFHDDIRLIHAARKARDVIDTKEDNVKYVDIAYYFSRNDKSLQYKIVTAKVYSKYKIDIHIVILRMNEDTTKGFDVIGQELKNNYKKISVNNIDYSKINKVCADYYRLNAIDFYRIRDIKIEGNFYLIEPKQNNRTEIAFVVRDEGKFFIATTIAF